MFLFQDLLGAMKMLGLNPMEQEIVDLTNNIVKNGFIYFPEFCKVIHKKFREDDEELFRQNMFKVGQQYSMFFAHTKQFNSIPGPCFFFERNHMKLMRQ